VGLYTELFCAIIPTVSPAICCSAACTFRYVFNFSCLVYVARISHT